MKKRCKKKVHKLASKMAVEMIKFEPTTEP
jgi:hypothetical protein